VDPDRCLEEIISLSTEILDVEDDECIGARRLAELVLDLDTWLTRHEGFLPVRWKAQR
jgi:hypothetical protein